MKSIHKLILWRSNASELLHYAASYINIRFISKDIYQSNRKSFNPFKKRTFREKESFSPHRICLTILGNGSIGQPRCIGLFTDTKGFLFNCGEGIGRLCREYEIDIYTLKHVFITQNTWRNLSGLPDIYISNEVYGVPKMTLYGPPGVEFFTSLVSSVRNDIRLKQKNSYEDENLEITYIPVESSSKGKAAVTFNYVVKFPEKLGEFNAEKCVELGVPFGPHLLKLKNGEDVVLQSGRVIYSADVLDAPQKRMVFLIVDCPSEDFLDTFIYESQFNEYQLPTDSASEVAAVFHYSSADIIKSEKYQEWIQKFHQNTEHYILNSSCPLASTEAVHHSQSILNLLHPEIFKLLPVQEKADPPSLSISSKLIYPPPMLQMNVRPEKKLNWCNVITNDFDQCTQMVKEIPDFSRELNKLEPVISQFRSKAKSEYPEVLFLGTSSSTSSAYRNVSAILVNLNSSTSILLDCGENAVAQLARYFGVPQLNSVLQRISCVFISHKHTDHYLGLFEFIKARIEAFENSGLTYKPLALILPSMIQRIFGRYCDIFESLKSEVRVYSCSNLTAENGYCDTLKNYLGDIKLETVPVKHCLDAYAIVLWLNSDWKIVYSGDTAPCQKLIDAGENCNLLIHEASIEDNLTSEASMKKHSTPSQVVDISEKMNAEYTIMTHFSKRYLAVPVFQEYDRKRIAIAFDFMKVRLNELPMLPHFLPALKCLFQEQIDSHLEKSSSVFSCENIFLKTYRSFKSQNRISVKHF